MKKIYAVIAVMLALMWPAGALAVDEPGDTQEDAVSVSLSVDNTNVYDGMDKAYNQGYSPTVKNGYATIVVPLVASGALDGSAIIVTPGLGDPSSSPFVFKNYQKTIGLRDNAVNGGSGTVSCYLVRFDLALASGRYNGVYPVTIDVQAQAADGSQIQQMLTCYVTITDGKNPNAAEPPPKTEKPTSQPKIIISGYSINPAAVEAGGEFTATVRLKNTSDTKPVQNMTVAVSCESPNFLLQNESSVTYIDKLGKGETTTVNVRYKTDLDTPAQRYNIMLAMEYDNSDAMTLSSSGSIAVDVSQPLRVEMEVPKMEDSVNAGDTMPLSFQVMNLGRSAIYNVRIELAAPGLIPSGSAFIGNMEAGTAMPGGMNVFVGTKNMTAGHEGEDKYGYTSGKITLIYEDDSGETYTVENDFSITINPPVIAPVSAEPAEEPEKAGQWWISIVIGGVVAAALAAYLIRRRQRTVKSDEGF